MNISDPKQQIQDYLAGQMSPEEEKQFDSWLKQNPEGQKLFKQSAKDYQAIRWAGQWDKPDEKQAYAQLQQRLHKHRLYSGLWKYAALFFLLLGCGIFFWQRHIPQPLPLASVESRANHKFPTLTLSNGRQVLLADTLQIIKGSSSKVNILQHDSGSLSYTPIRDTVPIKITYHTLTVPKGCEFSLTLSDGSHVWLNAGSKLKYPEVFADDHREVYLEGEAYFEVTRNEQASFSVHTRDMNLQVLGTSFNIKAYPDETETVTTLLSGSIEQHYPSSRQTLRLLPSQQSHFDCHTGNLQILEADPEEVLAWKNGKFIARDKTLEEIFRELTRWYDFEVVFTRPALRQLRFHLHTNRYASIREILDNLQSTNGIHFSYIGNKIYISQ